MITQEPAEDTLTGFLREDLGFGDITTNALIDSDLIAEARVVCKETATIAGIQEASALLELTDCHKTTSVKDGERVRSGAIVLTAVGPARSLLSIERTLLNLVSHMSGIATATADLVALTNKESRRKTRVACTRKTLPGLRYFEKRAVEIGGGDTHRLRLDDAVLIKDNHLALAGSIRNCVQKAKSVVSFTRKIEVEATTAEQVLEAASAGADIVLLDNMNPREVEASLSLLKTKGLRGQILVEASGGITKENIGEYAKTGVDIISVGAITHSARAIDASMEIRPAKKHR